MLTLLSIEIPVTNVTCELEPPLLALTDVDANRTNPDILASLEHKSIRLELRKGTKARLAEIPATQNPATNSTRDNMAFLVFSPFSTDFATTIWRVGEFEGIYQPSPTSLRASALCISTTGIQFNYTWTFSFGSTDYLAVSMVATSSSLWASFEPNQPELAM